MRPPHPSQPTRPSRPGPGAGNSGPFAAPPREHREKTRLTFTVFGDRLACTVAQETLSHKCLVPYDAERGAEATRTIVGRKSCQEAIAQKSSGKGRTGDRSIPYFEHDFE